MLQEESVMESIGELAGNIPEQCKAVVKKSALIIVGIMLVWFLNANHLWMSEYFPFWLEWLTLTRILIVIMAFSLMRYGWAKSDRAQNAEVDESVIFYEGTARVLGALIMINALVVPYKRLVNQSIPIIDKWLGHMPNQQFFMLALWIVVWSIILYEAIKMDKYHKVMGDIVTSEKAQKYVFGALKFILVLPAKILRAIRS
jgi:hypothetical protein